MRGARQIFSRNGPPPKNEYRYFSMFISGPMELENQSDNLETLRKWVAKLLADHPGPDYIVIRDEREDKNIFEEKGNE